MFKVSEIISANLPKNKLGEFSSLDEAEAFIYEKFDVIDLERDEDFEGCADALVMCKGRKSAPMQLAIEPA